MNIKYLTKAAVIAAIYAVLTIAFAPISYGPFQCRISEALCVLPVFTSAAIPGLFVGCVIANIVGGAGIWDIILGSLATLVAALLSYALKKHIWLVPLPPVIINAFVVAGYLSILGTNSFNFSSYIIMALWIGLGEAVSCYVLGTPLAFLIKKRFGEKL